MCAEGHRISYMRHADVYANFYADLYIRLNFMKFRIFVCILNINIYNLSLTLNTYEMWCGVVVCSWAISKRYGVRIPPLTIHFSKNFEVL
jgi:hypothetical protein